MLGNKNDALYAAANAAPQAGAANSGDVEHQKEDLHFEMSADDYQLQRVLHL